MSGSTSAASILCHASCFMVQVRLSHVGVGRAHLQVRLDLDGLDAVDVFAQLASQQVRRRSVGQSAGGDSVG